MSKDGSDLSRRRFLSASVSGIVTAGLLSAGHQQASAQQDNETPPVPEPEIITRPLGQTGVELPIVGMGVMNADNPEVLQASFDTGVRHFDTAAYYQSGNNEKMVGKVVKEMGIRDEVVIATKIFTPNYRMFTAKKDIPAKITSLCEESLKRLQMDHVDILYVHDLKDTATVSNEAITEAMAGLKEQGKARFIGITTHTRMHEIINAAIATGVYEVIETSFNFTMADDADLLKALEAAAREGIGLVAMKTQAGSHRRSNLDFGDRFSSETIATAALKWVLKNPNITTAIPGYTTFEHMRQDFSVAYDLEYTPQERKLLEECDIKLGMGFCRQCEVCLDSCPRGVDVPTLMRTHMYAARYSNFQEARHCLQETRPGRGIAACGSCKACVARCANCVDIPRNIEELKVMYT